jgi:6-pyruvoyltetrahydropterin/6-carboxytetrahydropterin synthase
VSDVFELVKQFDFEAAHQLPFVPEGHKCARLHGHSYSLEIVVRGELDEVMGWVVDYGEITKVVKSIVQDELDHRLLNDIPGLENPTSEILARWLWRRIRPELSGLFSITVSETSTSKCVYRGPTSSTF